MDIYRPGHRGAFSLGKMDLKPNSVSIAKLVRGAPSRRIIVAFQFDAFRNQESIQLFDGIDAGRKTN